MNEHFSELMDILFEGGNTRAINRTTGEALAYAEKIDFKTISRKDFVKDFIELLHILNKRYKDKYSSFIWEDFSVIETGFAFNGSASALFDKNITDDEFVKYKPDVGDIDVTIPHDCLSKLFELLSLLENEQITPHIKYLGQNKQSQSGHQINALFRYKDKTNCQIDFEGTEYQDSKPTDFTKFAHSSNWEDIKHSLKGVHHKYLLIDLVRALSEKEDIVIVTPASTIESLKKKKLSTLPRELAFSVDKGLRVKIELMKDAKGNPVELEGKKVYKELPTENSIYEKNIENIFEMIFKRQPTESELEEFGSFVGLVDLAKKYTDNQHIEKMFEILIDEHLWGKRAQGLERGNPKLDEQIKDKMVSYLIDVFPFLKRFQSKIENLKKDFYDNYQTLDVTD